MKLTRQFSNQGMQCVLIMSLLAIGSLTSSAHAQLDANNGANGIEFGIHNGEQPVAAFGPPSESSAPELYDSHVCWDQGIGQCCGSCPPGWRIRAEAMLLNHEAGGGNGVTLSNNFALSEFSYEDGGRVSITRHLDCLDAWELAYAGPFVWQEYGELNGVGLASRLASTTVNLSEFNNATFQSQSYRSRLHSAELNRRWYGWDVISTLVGVRYISIDEDFLYNTTGPVGTGSLLIETNNQMLGAQIGTELKFPVHNWMTTLSLKGALMANSVDGNLRLTNQGAVEVSNTAEDLSGAALMEIGYFFSYQVTPRVKVRGGYEMWWLYGFAGVPGQLTNPVTAGTGAIVDRKSDMYYHGASAGVEIVW